MVLASLELCRPRNFDDIVSGLLEQARAGLHRSTVAAFLSERYTERNAVFVRSQSRARDWLQCRRHRVSAFVLQAPHPTTDQGPFVRSYALCEEFAARNCIVYASARRLAALETLPASVHRIELDVASLESCQKAVNQVLREQGRIDVLVNNAGAGGAGALLDADVESEEGGKATVSL